eukprot:gene12235-16391_t
MSNNKLIHISDLHPLEQVESPVKHFKLLKNSIAITSPNLPLHEQEKNINKIINDISTLNPYDSKLPDHLEQFRKQYEKVQNTTVKLPLISSLSPRSKKKVSLLPAPNEHEEREIKGLIDQAKRVKTDHFYKKINKSNQNIDVLDESKAITFDHLNKNILPPSIATDSIKNTSKEYFETIQIQNKRKNEQSHKISLLLNDKNKNHDPLNEDDNNTNSSSTTIDLQKSPSIILPSIHSSLKSSTLTNNAHHPNHNVPVRSDLMDYIKEKITINNNTIDEQNQNRGNGLSSKYSKNKYYNNFIMSDSNRLEINNNDVYKNNDHNVQNYGQQELQSSVSLSNLNVSLSDKYENKIRPSASTFTTKSILYHNKNESKSVKTNNSTYNLIENYQPIIHNTIKQTQQIQQNIDQEFSKLKIVTNQPLLQPNKQKEYLNQFSSQVYDEIGLIVDPVFIRKNEIEKNKYLSIQKMNALKVQKEYELKLHKNATKIKYAIFKFVKMKKIRKSLYYRKSITLIQKVTRGWLTYKKVHVRILHVRLRKRSAIIIQCAYRIRLAHRKVILHRKIRIVEDYLSNIQNHKDAIHNHFCSTGAELQIARAYRAYRLKVKIRKLIYWNHVKCVLIIQRVYRGAVKLQRLFRGNKARALYLQMYLEKEKELDQKYKSKLKKLDQGRNNSISWSIRFMIRKIHPLKHRLYSAKALVIQRIWRGHHGRIRFFIIKIQHKMTSEKKQLKFKNKNACLIQACWRGYYIRLEIHKKKRRKMAILVQCMWRQHLARANVRKQQSKRYYGAKLAKNLYNLFKMRKFRRLSIYYNRIRKQVILIQSQMRRYLGKRKFHFIKSLKRQKLDQLLAINLKINGFISSIELKLINETMIRPIGYSFVSYCNNDCIGYGPLQGAFVMSGCKGRNDPTTLITNKIDAASSFRFITKIKDLLFSKSKGEFSTGNVLNYSDFLEYSRKIAELHYTGKITSIINEKIMKKITLLSVLMTSFFGFAQPSNNAPVPTKAPADVISVYSDSYTNIATNYNPGWNQSGTVNPTFNPGGSGNFVMAYTNFNYQGTNLTAQNAAGMEFLHVDVWSSANPANTILQVSPINQGTGASETLVTINYTQNSWYSVDIPKSAFTGMTWNNIFQMKFAANGAGSTVPANFYLDNIYFWKTPTATGTDATLSNLQVSGATIPGFSGAALDYNYDLVVGTTVIPQITLATTNDPLATITLITQATAIPGTASVKVTSQNGAVIKTYTVNFAATIPNQSPTPSTPNAEVLNIYSDT